MVRAKFRLDSIERSIQKYSEQDESGQWVNHAREVQTLVLHPVYGNGDPNHENTKFWNASPGGELRLNCVNAQAVAQFELDREYYVDFTPADR